MALILTALYLQPASLVNVADSLLGRGLMLVFIILVANRSLAIGALATLLCITLLGSASRKNKSKHVVEGLEDHEATSAKAKFRKKNCKDGALTSPGNGTKPVAAKDVSKVYPRVKFANPVAPCDPCDTDCKFDLLDVDETLTRGFHEARESEEGTTLKVKPKLKPRLKKPGKPNDGDLPTLPPV